MRRVTDDRGAVAIVVALTMTALLGMAALAIDVGLLLVEHRALQNGADAAALAVAHDCTRRVAYPSGPTPCTSAQALATAINYLDANSPNSPVPDRELVKSNGDRVGRITVTGEIQQPPIFARFVGVTNPLPVGAAAVARWGPVITMDTVFPLMVCKGALPAPDTLVTLQATPWPMLPAPFDCDGRPFFPPFGWATPDDPVACTTEIDLLPPTSIDVDPPDVEPGGAGCISQIDQLHDDIDFGTAADRTRILAVFDQQASFGGPWPGYALIAFEFTGAKLGGRISHAAPGVWSGACDPADLILRCVEGYVRVYIPPEDSQIVDPTVVALPGINDSTVLDVRLVD